MNGDRVINEKRKEEAVKALHFAFEIQEKVKYQDNQSFSIPSKRQAGVLCIACKK
jgi:hypothetical protein